MMAASYGNGPAKASAAKDRTPPSYCGVSCLYVLMKLADKEINYTELLTKEYIGSPEGSSLAELKKATEDFGLHAMPVGKLTTGDLGQSCYPIILHVKSEIGSKRYDHYELLLGTEKGKAKLLDPPGFLRLVPFHELVPRWDGNGMVVSAKPIDSYAVLGSARKRFIAYAVIAVAIVLIVRWVKRWLPQTILTSRCKSFGLSMTQGAGFTIAALLCGMIYHFANDGGLLANPNATASIQQAHQGNFIPKISERKVRTLLDSDTIFIDARYDHDFKAGHLERAISVPVDANDVQRREATVDIEKDARVVLYCQSSRCKYAEIVAIKLIEDGYSNISIFKGGWAGWVARNGRPKEAAI